MRSTGSTPRNESPPPNPSPTGRHTHEEVKAADTAAVHMPSNTVTATDQNFAELIAGPKPVLVDFWAEWCGPCHMVAPFLEEIAAEHADKITVAKLNVDENQQTALQFNVQGIPTLIVFRNGQPTHTRIIGARPKAALLTELSEYLA